MNLHWFFFFSVIFGAWFVAQTESSTETAAAGEEKENVGRSARAWFGSSSKNETASTTPGWVMKYPITTPRSNTTRYGIFATTARPKTPLTTTANWLRASRPTHRPSKVTAWPVGWVVTTSPKTNQTTKKTKNKFGWDITTTSRPLSTTKIRLNHNERRTTTTQRSYSFNTTSHIGWGITATTPRPISTTNYSPQQAGWGPQVTTPWPISTTNYSPHQAGWGPQVTTPRPISTTSFFPNQAGWGTQSTTKKNEFEWFPTTTPPTTWPTPIPAKNNSKVFGGRNKSTTRTTTTTTTTKRPTEPKPVKIIRTKTTTQNPFGGYGRRNQTSPNVGVWTKITPLNSQLPHQPYPHPHVQDSGWNQWNANNNHQHYVHYPGPKYMQTSVVIPQNTNHLGYHFVTTYDNGFWHAVPINSRHYFEQSYHYHNNNNNRDPSQLQMRPTLSPFGQSPVLYKQLHTPSDHQNNEDSAESALAPPAMIVGLENLIILCHFDENDDDVFVYMNHDDVAEEDTKKAAEQKFGKYLLDLVQADIEKQGVQQNAPPPDTNQIFASLNGQQVESNRNLPSMDRDFHSDQNQLQADISQIFASQNNQFSVSTPNVNQQSSGAIQPPNGRHSMPLNLSEFLATMHTSPSDVSPIQFGQTSATPNLNELMAELNRETSGESKTDATPSQWTI